MNYQDAAIFQLAISGAVLCLFLVLPWIRRAATIGLPFCYLISLAMIHWLGAFIHVLPWDPIRDTYVHRGFREAFWGILSFAAGSAVVAPFVLRFVLGDRQNKVLTERARMGDSRLPMRYLLLGTVFYAVLAPGVRFIPSIGAVVVCGVYLIVVALCLSCWQAHLQQKPAKLLCWLLIVCSIPFLTVVTIGFIGYGAVASLLVLTFVASYHRPRWQAVVGLGLLIFLGLSLFVTYARDRSTLRRTIWGGADYNERIEKIRLMLEDFEIIDFHNPRHLRLINARLNQNYLVGRAMETLESGRQQYAGGATLYEAMLALVPRIIWPDKPVRAGSPDIVSRYTRIKFAAGTSVGVGQVMEFYINFGTAGVIAGFFIIGVLLTTLDSIAALHLRMGNWQAFMSWFVPSISLLNVGGSLVEVFGTTAASVALVFLIRKTFPTRTQPYERAGTNTLTPIPSNQYLYARATAREI